MDKTKGMLTFISILIAFLLIVNGALFFVIMSNKTKNASTTGGESVPKETLMYDVNKGEAITANLKSKDPKYASMMLRVSVTIEYDKGSLFNKPITEELTAKETIIKSIVTDTIKSTSAEDLISKGEQAKYDFQDSLKDRLKDEFGKSIYRVHVSEFIYN